MGAGSMTAHLAVLEELANGLQRTSDSAYVAYIERMRTEDCLGVVAKIESGKITEETIAAFLEAGRLLGLHQARSNAATELRAAIALMRGQSWQPIETAPKDRRILLFQGGVWKGGWDECERKWMGAGAGVFIVQPTHWMELPTPPAAKQERDDA